MSNQRVENQVTTGALPARIRSPLRTQINRSDPGRFGRWTGRMLSVSTVAFLVLVFAGLVAFRLFPKSGLGYLIYWLHDNIFLVIRAYTLTLNWPFSLILWGVFVTWALARIFGFLFQVSVIRYPYVRWIAPRVIRASTRHMLVAWSRTVRATWLARHLRIEPALLLEYVWRERARALNALVVNNSRHTAMELQHLTELWVGLYPPHRPTNADYLQMVGCCLQALVHIQVYVMSRPPRYAVQALAERIATLARLLSQNPGKDPSQVHKSGELGWALDTIADDLLLLTKIVQHDAPVVPLKLTTLVESIESRRRALMQASREMVSLADADARSRAEPGTLAASVPEADALPWLGYTALWIAIMVGRLGKAPTIALSFLDAMQAAELAVSWSLAPKAWVRGLVEKTPELEQYRICQVVAQDLEIRRDGAWKEAFRPVRLQTRAEEYWSGSNQRAKAIGANAFGLYQDQIQRLEQAMGPVVRSPVPTMGRRGNAQGNRG